MRLTGKYRYLTFEDRKKIEAWHLLGDRPVDIAARLSVHHTTIYKELQRGATGALDANQREGYSAELAERRLRESFKRRGKRAPAAQYATGGFTSGPSIAGEDPRYPTEAVISFNPAYRSQNLSYWAEAGRMLGASSEADYEPISSGSGTAVVYDLSGLSFSPQIKVEGDTDEDALIRKLRDLEPEFIDFILEALSRREGGAYVTADSRLY